MLIAFMIFGVMVQAAFAVVLIMMCLAAAGAVVWIICND